MSLREQYPSLEEGHDLKAVMRAVLSKHGIVPDSGIVSELTQAAESFIHGQIEAEVSKIVPRSA